MTKKTMNLEDFKTGWEQMKITRDYIIIRMKDCSYIRTDKYEAHPDGFILFFYNDSLIAIVRLESVESIYNRYNLSDDCL